MTETKLYPLPLYLNQKYVFNILAMMENGFSQLESVKLTQTEQGDKTNKVTSELGLKNAFTFFTATLGGERTTKTQAGNTQETTKEKVYTPNSLFAKTREQLHRQNLVKPLEVENIRAGDFVEFKTNLRKNPLIDAIESLVSLMETVLVFEEIQVKPKNIKPSESSNKKLLDQLHSFLEKLTSDSTMDILGSKNDEEVESVLTLDKAFLSNPTLSDLVNGEFTVLGKVTKVIDNEDSSINLLRKTSMGSLTKSLLEEMTKHFSNLQASGIVVPEIITEINGPVVQVMPIAIFA